MKEVNFPINLGRYVIAPGRKLIAYSVEIKANRIGILRDISNVISGKEGDIMYFHLQINPDKKGLIFMILDITSMGEDPEELKKSIEKVEGVGKVFTLRPMKEGLIIDTHSFPAYVGSNRVVIVRDILLKSAKKELAKRIGDEATNILLYNIGYEMGLGAGDSHLELARALGITDPIEVVRLISIPLFKALGYGYAEIEAVQEGNTLWRMRIYRDIECEIVGSSNKPACSLISGMWAGVITRILGKDVVAKETKCRAMGDEYCEIEVELRE